MRAGRPEPSPVASSSGYESVLHRGRARLTRSVGRRPVVATFSLPIIPLLLNPQLRLL